LKGILKEWKVGGEQGLCPVPDEPLPPIGTLGFRVQRYGMLQWGDLFTARQKVAMVIITKIITKLSSENAISAISLSIGKVLRHCNVISKWHRGSETTAGAFGMQALPMSWDFPEMHPFAPYAGGLQDALDDFDKAVLSIKTADYKTGSVGIMDAMKHLLPDQSSDIWFTDPPYYDAIPYADLSDFFFVWHKRLLSEHNKQSSDSDFQNRLSPKNSEIVQDDIKEDNGRLKDRYWFEESMAKAFSEGQRVLNEDGIGAVVFAHKTTEGWEALLSGMTCGGWTITGSWPIATERGARLRARDSAALATSIHLICRPRLKDASVGDWADVLRELPERVSSWMSRLKDEGIRGADLVFACIGPALEIFSRYRSVETAEGHEVKLSEYLEKVWEVVGRTALEQVLGTTEDTSSNVAGVLEEDARLTALFLWTLQSTDAPKTDSSVKENGETYKLISKGFTLPFDVVRRFAQPMGIDLDDWKDSIISISKGVVRLLPVTERSKDLFGEDGISTTAEWIERDTTEDSQGSLFPELGTDHSQSQHHNRTSIIEKEVELQSGNATVLDRVHAAMLLYASGHANALRTLINSEMSRGPEFLHLANALSALYPGGSQEKRLIDAMLLAVPR